jgi:hypothetical protein
MKKKDKDIISEEEFNLQSAASSTLPEEDSPGDSEADSGSEFEMGLEYTPDEDTEEIDEDGGDEPGDLMFAETNEEKKIPETAKVISSDLPSPWADLDSDSDTH